VQRRGWLIGGLVIVSLCILCCALTFVVALPRLRDGFQDSVRDAVSTEVSKQIPATAGSYTITEESLQASLRQSASDDNADDLVVELSPAGIELGISAQSQHATYTGQPAAVDGRFVMQDMDTNSSILGFFLSPDDLGTAVEDAVNNYLAANDLRLESVTLAEGEMTLQVADAS
jgi:hypothetical protein